MIGDQRERPGETKSDTGRGASTISEVDIAAWDAEEARR